MLFVRGCSASPGAQRRLTAILPGVRLPSTTGGLPGRPPRIPGAARSAATPETCARTGDLRADRRSRKRIPVPFARTCAQ